MEEMEVDETDEWAETSSKAPFLVAFRNVQDTVTESMVALLVQSISGLSQADFGVEIIPNNAVITFLKNIDVMAFVKDCSKHPRIQELQIFPHLLEQTRIIRVENLPPNVAHNYITIFFGSTSNGENTITNIQYFPEERSALIEFSDYKAVDTFLDKKLVFDGRAISVFPYYASLGTALYGKKKSLKDESTLFENFVTELEYKWFNEERAINNKFKNLFSTKDHHSKGDVLYSTQTKEGLPLILIKGDIWYFTADVIVNSVPANLQLGGEAQSQALLDKAGPVLQIELNAAGDGKEEPVGSMFMTSGASLNCRTVFHVVPPDWNNGVGLTQQIMANIILECLTRTEDLSLSSIIFPVIGTRNQRFPKAIFANLILSEVFQFSSLLWRRILHKVYFLVHTVDEESTQAFLDAFTRRSGGSSKDSTVRTMTGGTQGVFGTAASPWPASSTQPASSPQHASGPQSIAHEMQIGAITFQVAIGDITKERADVIVNSTTKTFNGKSGVSKAILEAAGPAVESECAALAAKPHQDFIVSQGGYLMCNEIIHVNGDSNVRKTVYKVLLECRRKRHSSVCFPAIGTGNAGKKPAMVADDIINGIADFTQKHSAGLLKTVKVVLFLPHLLQVFCDRMAKRKSQMSPAIPFPSSGTAGDVPMHWTCMNQQPLRVVQLQPGQSEYNTVQSKFKETCALHKIEKIERIENVDLWQCYQVKKKQMDAKNGHTNNERFLFHGTDVDSVPHVNQHGFNRSYAGKNAAAYGKGTYFAVDASYSSSDTFSRPDRNGRKHMYVARVLTGIYTRGSAHLLTPPSKNPDNPTELFDSVTDNTQNPKIFVVFFDYQAYPEYLITFQSSGSVLP